MSSRARSWMLAGALCAVALSGCGGGHQSTTPQLHAGQETVHIYFSLPLEGPGRDQALSVLDGIKLALSQRFGTAGFYTIDPISLDDSYAKGGLDPTLVAANATRVATDPRGVYYIGDWASEASEVSIPILNQAGVPQVSLASTYLGLTSLQAGAGKYYPSGTRTFLRLVPSGSVEAAADLMALRQLHCGTVAVGHDLGIDGTSIAQLIDLERNSYRVNVVSELPAEPSSSAFPGWIAFLKRSRASCVVWAGSVADGGSAALAAIHQALPAATILGTDGVCTGSWTTRVPPSVDRSLWCTAPGPDLAATAIGRLFLTQFKKAYDISNPDPAAVYGYEAMKLGLDTIATLGAQGNIKADVLGALFATRGPSSPIGTYSFNRNGDITPTSYGLYRFRGGAPVWFSGLTPSRVP